jgi:hypothetical protein
MIVARQFTALEMSNNKIRPVGYGMIWSPGLIHCPGLTTRLTDQITPSLRDGFLFRTVPGSKLPGYDHLVPPGQTHLGPQVDAHPAAAGLGQDLAAAKCFGVDSFAPHAFFNRLSCCHQLRLCCSLGGNLQLGPTHRHLDDELMSTKLMRERSLD